MPHDTPRRATPKPGWGRAGDPQHVDVSTGIPPRTPDPDRPVAGRGPRPLDHRTVHKVFGARTRTLTTHPSCPRRGWTCGR